MGTIIRAVGVNAEATAEKFVDTVGRGLEGLHFLNDDIPKLSRNYAVGKANGSVIGVPVSVGSSSVRFASGSSGVQTQVAESANMTIFVVAKAPARAGAGIGRGMIFGTYRSPSAANPSATIDGVALYSASADTLIFGATVDRPEGVGFATATLPIAQLDQWALYSICVVDGGTWTIRNETLGVNATVSSTHTQPRVPSNGAFRIGTSPINSASFGQCDIAVWRYHSEALSRPEIESVNAVLRSYVAGRGITV